MRNLCAYVHAHARTYSHRGSCFCGQHLRSAASPLGVDEFQHHAMRTACTSSLLKGGFNDTRLHVQPMRTYSTPAIGAGDAGPMLLVARGTTARPTFESVSLSQQHLQQQRAGKKDGSPAVIELQAALGGVLLGSTAQGLNGPGSEQKSSSKAAKLQHSRQDVTVLGPENQVRVCLGGWVYVCMRTMRVHPCL